MIEQRALRYLTCLIVVLGAAVYFAGWVLPANLPLGVILYRVVAAGGVLLFVVIFLTLVFLLWVLTPGQIRVLALNKEVIRDVRMLRNSHPRFRNDVRRVFACR